MMMILDCIISYVCTHTQHTHTVYLVKWLFFKKLDLYSWTGSTIFLKVVDIPNLKEADLENEKLCRGEDGHITPKM